MANNERLFFVDLETSGLEPRMHDILEIGILVVDQDLQEVASWSRVIKHDLEKVLFDPEAYDMHRKNGLLDAVPRGVKMEVAVAECRHFLLEHGIHTKNRDGSRMYKAAMCGSSVHFDRAYLAVYAPEVESLFSHRNIDVSSISGICRVWNPRFFFDGLTAPDFPTTHRTLDDCRRSVAILSKFRPAFESLRL